MIIKTIKLTSLFVNTENYRFEPLSSQKEAIDKMVEDQEDKLYSLVDDIVTNGLSPVDLIIVTPSEDNSKYTVLEGNRRITSLKLLNNPTLIDDKYASLRKKFQKLQKDKANIVSELKSISCAVFENPAEADIWIKRKHSGELNGVGTVTWNAQQKQRFEEKTEGKSSIPLQIITLLRSQNNVPEDIKDSLSKLNITNLQRLMSDPYVREHLGLEINNGTLVSKIQVSEVIKGLLKVVTDILNPEFKVADIYNREKRKQYIDSFISILIFIILISVSGLLATLVLVFSRKVLIDEAGVHIYVWKRKKKELRWNHINKIEIVLVGRGVLMIHFYTNTKIGLDITTLQVSNYCIRCLSKFAPDFIKGALAVELSRFGVSI